MARQQSTYDAPTDPPLPPVVPYDRSASCSSNQSRTCQLHIFFMCVCVYWCMRICVCVRSLSRGVFACGWYSLPRRVIPRRISHRAPEIDLGFPFSQTGTRVGAGLREGFLPLTSVPGFASAGSRATGKAKKEVGLFKSPSQTPQNMTRNSCYLFHRCLCPTRRNVRIGGGRIHPGRGGATSKQPKRVTTRTPNCPSLTVLATRDRPSTSVELLRGATRKGLMQYGTANHATYGERKPVPPVAHQLTRRQSTRLNHTRLEHTLLSWSAY